MDAFLISKLLFGALLLLALLSFAGCSKTDVYEWGNKYTVTIETPSGEVSAHSVVGEKLLDRRNSPQFGSGNAWSFAMKGEAVVLDLGNKPKGPHYLFALVVRNQYLPFRIAGEALNIPVSNYADIASRFDEVDWPVALPGRYYPLLVTFDDINDPASVKRVDPFDMDASLGLCPDGSGLRDENAPWRAENMLWRDWARYKVSGVSSLAEYRKKVRSHGFNRPQEEKMEAAIVPRDTSNDCHRLQSITLEITGEPVTTGKVEEVLGWHRKIPDEFWRTKLTDEQQRILSSVNWVRE